MSTRDSTTALIAEIEAAARRHGLAPTTLCRLVVRDGKFFRRLLDGGDCTLRTADRIRAFIMGLDDGWLSPVKGRKAVTVIGKAPIEGVSAA